MRNFFQSARSSAPHGSRGFVATWMVRSGSPAPRGATWGGDRRRRHPRSDALYVLVGAGEEDFDTGRINVASPLAQGLLGKRVGETVSIQVPAGTMRMEILEVRFEED